MRAILLLLFLAVVSRASEQTLEEEDEDALAAREWVRITFSPFFFSFLLSPCQGCGVEH